MTRAVVVGSGPNGLAAALTLARAGIDVQVLEGAAEIGGGTRSSDLTGRGLIHDECSGFHPLAVNTRFSRAFDLTSYGLKWVWPEVQYSHPLDHGRGAAAVRSVTQTAEGLGIDEARWRHVFGSLATEFDRITDDFLQPMLRFPDHPLLLARFGLRSGLPAALLARLWRTQEARALFGGVAAHAMYDFAAPMSAAIGVALATAAHAYGWPVAEGGSISISRAILGALHGLDAKIVTGTFVKSIAELGNPDIVMLDVAPTAAVQILGDRMPPRIRRALARYRHGPGVFKVDYVIDGHVPWTFAPSRHAGTVHLGGTLAEIEAAERAVNKGSMPPRPFVLVGQQYLADPSRSAGTLNPLYAYAHVPAGYTGDATAAIEQQIERFAPGFRDRVVARHVRSTTDFAHENPNYVGGDIVTGLNSARQLIFRPRVARNPYAVGVPGVYLCSAATPPGAGAHGMSGYNAAESALRYLRR